MHISLSEGQAKRFSGGLQQLKEANHVVIPDFYSDDQVDAMVRVANRMPALPVPPQFGRQSTLDLINNWRDPDGQEQIPYNRRLLYTRLASSVIRPLLGPVLELQDELSEIASESDAVPRGKWQPNLTGINKYVSLRGVSFNSGHFDHPCATGPTVSSSLGPAVIMVDTEPVEVDYGDLELFANVDLVKKYGYERPWHAIYATGPRFSIVMAELWRRPPKPEPVGDIV